ncbi:MAG: OmpA family protein [Bacteroidetes bacterium]|nr:OmpA family protein [Bacteroidota bacterium]
MKKIHFNLIIFALIAFSFTSCVTQKRYTDLETKYKKCNDDLTTIEKAKNDIVVQNTELNADLEKVKKQKAELEDESSMIKDNYEKLQAEQAVLSTDYSAMQQKYTKLLGGNRTETSEIMEALQKTQADLLKKETDLKKTEADMQKMQNQLNEKKNNLDSLSALMDIKEKKLNELQTILDNKDKQVADLKNKITTALLGFKDKGLTIETRNGKVYVSMEEKLLFASGSWNVAEEGKDALKSVAKVLETNPDINVTIEGHTDNIPYNGIGQVRDNWDLSVLRATSIVKIILENKSIDAKRIVASGRSQYLPIETTDTKEARAKNRRTEIILTPKLDELMKVLDNN